jgi:hypothetical protein
MGVGTPYGEWYVSQGQTQNFPTGLFSAAPDAVHINIYNQIVRCWIMHDPTEVLTSSHTDGFCVASDGMTTLSSSDIGFTVLGRWKEAE